MPLPETIAHAPTKRSPPASLLPSLPAIAVAVLAKFACPACWPAYAGVLGALGLGFVLKDEVMLPLTVLFLSFALLMLFFRATRRRGYGPFALGCVASVLILGGSFAWRSNAVLFPGVALLIAASFWNTWPKKSAGPAQCAACTPTAEDNRPLQKR